MPSNPAAEARPCTLSKSNGCSRLAFYACIVIFVVLYPKPEVRTRNKIQAIKGLQNYASNINSFTHDHFDQCTRQPTETIEFYVLGGREKECATALKFPIFIYCTYETVADWIK